MLQNLEINNRTPITIQIVERVKFMLRKGELNPGDQLPTVRQLADELRVNFNTVARAYRVLDEEHILSTQQGRGTFVLSGRARMDDSASRLEQLESLAYGFLVESANQGFRPEEVQMIIKPLLQKWLKDRRLTSLADDNYSSADPAEA